MRNLILLFLLLSFSSYAQTGGNKGTIKVKKEKEEPVLELASPDGNMRYGTTYSIPEDTSVFTVVDRMPEYAGGMAAMNKFIFDNLKFPTEGLQQTGTCYASFVVNKDGTVSNIRIVRVSDCPACDQEVLRVLRLMPQNWTCGRQNNFPVRVQVNLPVRINVG